MKLFADSIYGFSGAPIALILIIGLLSTLLFGLLALLTSFAAVMNWIEIPGYTTLVIVGAVGHSLTITACGIIGGYVFRAFDNSKGRPRYIIAEINSPARFQDAARIDENDELLYSLDIPLYFDLSSNYFR
jgi:hypothetical protein